MVRILAARYDFAIDLDSKAAFALEEIEQMVDRGRLWDHHLSAVHKDLHLRRDNIAYYKGSHLAVDQSRSLSVRPISVLPMAIQNSYRALRCTGVEARYVDVIEPARSSAILDLVSLNA